MNRMTDQFYDGLDKTQTADRADRHIGFGKLSKS